ncbi:carbohydrate kinase family protein [Hoeflea poritis]|uniref:Carbohydrate kinase family protein n=1 Tax=Hoeflea poritis TaxID=2993659 RepID=A0ABT4VW59_9HYPH|nr:carbohydrate kinase family protein [Hoeflea poritis]MDA4848243.1 carbohydrate kinase family protein [Hoeflea poritis]
MARIIVLGGAHIDRRATIDGATVPGASNPGRWREEPGGGGFNAARSLARLGHEVAMVSVRGGDRAGEAVGTAMETVGVEDMAQVFLDRATPSYTAILENDGNLLVAVADMDLYDRFVYRQLSRKSIRQAIADANLVLCDANLPAGTIGALAQMTGMNGKPLCAIAISPPKVERLEPAFGGLSMIFMNAAEAAVLCGQDTPPDKWPGKLRERGIARGAISRGEGPVLGFDGTDVFQITPPRIESVVDVTGAGDTLAAAAIHATLNGNAFRAALRYGVAAAGLAVQSADAAPPELNIETVEAALKHVPQAEPFP